MMDIVSSLTGMEVMQQRADVHNNVLCMAECYVAIVRKWPSPIAESANDLMPKLQAEAIVLRYLRPRSYSGS